MDEYIFLLKNSAIFAGVKEDEILTMLHCLNAVKASKRKILIYCGLVNTLTLWECCFQAVP